MTRSRHRLAAVAATVAGLAVAGAFTMGIADSALASGDDVGKSAIAVGGAGAPALSMMAVVTKLKALGYTDIRKVEHERGRYRVKARDAKGARVALSVDGATGKILRSEQKRSENDGSGHDAREQDD